MTSIFNLKTFLILSTISSIKQALKYRTQLSNFINYAEKNNLTGNTAFGGIYKTAQELNNAFNMGYYYNDVLQDIAKDSIFISAEDGSPVLYKTVGNLKSKNGEYSLQFSKFDLRKGTTTNGAPDFDSIETITGTATEVQSILQAN